MRIEIRAPFRWHGIDSTDLRHALHRTHTPKLHGFRLAKDEVEALTGVKAVIERNTSPGDPIFAFPHMPLFYIMTDRWPDTLALLHWFDNTPDSVFFEDMRRLEEKPPKVIIVLDIPEYSWQLHEQAFRGGRRAVMREMLHLLERMTSEPGAYTLEATYISSRKTSN